MPVIESGNTDVGLRAGEFIIRNREMALRQALAAQEAQRDMARLQLQREQMIQQQRAAADEAMRRDAANAAEMNYRYAALRQSGEQSALERQARGEESAASRAQALKLAQMGDTSAMERLGIQERGATERAKLSEAGAKDRHAESIKIQEQQLDLQRKDMNEREQREINKEISDRTKEGYLGLGGVTSWADLNARVEEQRDYVEQKKKADKIAEEKRNLEHEFALIRAKREPTEMEIVELKARLAAIMVREGEDPRFTSEQLDAFENSLRRKISTNASPTGGQDGLAPALATGIGAGPASASADPLAAAKAQSTAGKPLPELAWKGRTAATSGGKPYRLVGGEQVQGPYVPKTPSTPLPAGNYVMVGGRAIPPGAFMQTEAEDRSLIPQDLLAVPGDDEDTLQMKRDSQNAILAELYAKRTR